MTQPLWKTLRDVLHSKLAEPNELTEEIPTYAERADPLEYPSSNVGKIVFGPSEAFQVMNFDIEVWSEEAGQSEVKELMATADAVLMSGQVEVPGYQTISLRLLSAGVVRQYFEDREPHYRGRLTYAIKLQKDEN